MTNPTSSNTGMSALFAVASAVAGKTEDLSEKEVNGTVLKAFLAGQTLTFGIKVVDVRAASAEEIAHKHVHGEHGHHH